MKFSANRKIMLEHLKTMLRIVPKASAIKEINGLLIEADEDEGCLYMTANNLESAIQRKFKANVEEYGDCIMDARLLVNMLLLLGGDNVSFEEIKTGIVEIKSGNCTYTVSVLSGKAYPKPDIPFPGDTVKMSGLKQMYNKTFAATANGDASKALSGIHIDITQKQVRAIGCNAHEMAVASQETDSGGAMSFTLHRKTFSDIAGAAGDDELEIGKSGASIVFMKEGMLFSAKPILIEYLDADMILNSMQTQYLAKLEIDEFRQAIEYIADIAYMSSEKSYVCMGFGDDKIDISTANDIGRGSTEIRSILIEGTPGVAYHYPAPMLKNVFRTVEGTILLQLDKRGYLIVMDKHNKFMLTPIRDASVQKQAEKFAGKMKAKKDKESKKAA